MKIHNTDETHLLDFIHLHSLPLKLDTEPWWSNSAELVQNRILFLYDRKRNHNDLNFHDTFHTLN